MVYLESLKLMKRFLILFFIPSFLIITILLSGFYLFSRRGGKGGLQVTSIPKSKVYLDGNLLGETPMCKCDADGRIASGEYTLRLVPEEAGFLPFETKVKIDNQLLTVVDRTFAKGASSEGSIINLSPIEDKKTELQILSFPKDADILLDGNLIGKSPIIQKDVTESDHEVTLRKEGYKDKTIRIRAAAGFRLVAVVYLGIAPISSQSGEIEASLSAVASSSASVKKVIILSTPTNYLNVRNAPSLTGSIVAQVNPGESYDLISEETGWYEIKLSSSSAQAGWISSTYAEKQ